MLTFDGTDADRAAYRATVEAQLEIFVNRPGEYWVRWNVNGRVSSIPGTVTGTREDAEAQRQRVIDSQIRDYDFVVRENATP